MATVVPIGEPVNDAERQAIAHLRDHLPSSYTIFHNFEIRRAARPSRLIWRCLRPTPSISST